jgi:hypothetical protein
MKYIFYIVCYILIATATCFLGIFGAGYGGNHTYYYVSLALFAIGFIFLLLHKDMAQAGKIKDSRICAFLVLFFGIVAFVAMLLS